MIPQKVKQSYILLSNAQSLADAVSLLLMKQNNNSFIGAEPIIAKSIKLGFEIVLIDIYGEEATRFIHEINKMDVYGDKNNINTWYSYNIDGFNLYELSILILLISLLLIISMFLIYKNKGERYECSWFVWGFRKDRGVFFVVAGG